MAVAGVLGLAACTTEPTLPLMSPLAAAGAYGYTERQIDGERFEVTYVGPFERSSMVKSQREKDSESARALAYDLALWRAAEVALEHDYPAFAIEHTRANIETEIIDESPVMPLAGIHHPAGSEPFGFHGFEPRGFRSAWVQARVTLTVRLTSTVTQDAFDAAATIERLKDKHPEALATPPP